MSIGIDPGAFRVPGPGELKVMRDICDLTQQQVAERIDRSYQTVCRIERESQEPKRETLSKLLDLYRDEWPEAEP